MKLHAVCINPSSNLEKNGVYLVEPLLRKNIGTSFEYFTTKDWHFATHLKVLDATNKGGYNLIVTKNRFVKKTPKKQFQQPKQTFTFEMENPKPIYNLIHSNDNTLTLLGVHRGTLAKYIRDRYGVSDDFIIQKVFWNGKELVTEDVTNKLKWEPIIP